MLLKERFTTFFKRFRERSACSPFYGRHTPATHSSEADRVTRWARSWRWRSSAVVNITSAAEAADHPAASHAYCAGTIRATRLVSTPAKSNGAFRIMKGAFTPANVAYCPSSFCEHCMEQNGFEVCSGIRLYRRLTKQRQGTTRPSQVFALHIQGASIPYLRRIHCFSFSSKCGATFCLRDVRLYACPCVLGSV